MSIAMSPTHEGGIQVTPAQLFVRCFAEKKHGQWQAFSLEYGLAAQADTRDEVRAKLDSMIASYVEDALGGEDSKYGATLLRRKSTISVWLKYHVYALLDKLRNANSDGTANLFEEIVPLAPIQSALQG